MRLAAALVLVVLAAGAQAQGVGSCAPGTATGTLQTGHVRAAVQTTGVLFAPDTGYEVPKGSGRSPVARMALWAGGTVGGALRFSGTTTGPVEYWPGPLAPDGGPPTDASCRQSDRVWSVTLDDVARYNATGVGTPDLLAWPADLGAPVVDGDGDGATYNLAGGDRPAVYGGQTVWTRFNDRGGPHAWSLADPVGLDVRMTASALSDTMAGAYPPALAAALRTAAHVRLDLTYRGTAPVDSFYVGLFIDGELGFGGDDYVGTAPGLNMVYVYNGDDTDEGPTGYGAAPPAFGVVAGEPPPGVVTRLSHLVVGGDPDRIGEPQNGAEAYALMRGFSRDGSLRWTVGGLGTFRVAPESPPGDGTPGPEIPTDPPLPSSIPRDPTTATFSGRPPAFWSEYNIDAVGTRRAPGERRMMLSQGPYRLLPGQSVRLDLALAYARGATPLASVYALIEAAQIVRLLPAEPIRDLATIRPGDPRLTQPSLPIPPGGPVNTKDPSLYVVPVPNPQRSGAGELFLYLYGRGPVRVRVVDALGRVVADRPSEVREVGPWEVALPPLAAGVYTYEVTAVYEGFEPRVNRGRLTVVR